MDAGAASKACRDASASASTFCFGIEEEYFLVHRGTRDLIRIEQPKLMAALKEALADQVASEFLCSQIEISTPVCHSAQQARSELARLRRTIIEVAAGCDLSVVAASTHPFAQWSGQTVADQPRYHQIAHDLAGVGRRLNTCGMHVHVGIDDKETRIAVMNKARALLPLLLALSSSSPFWQGRNTGTQVLQAGSHGRAAAIGTARNICKLDGLREYERDVVPVRRHR